MLVFVVFYHSVRSNRDFVIARLQDSGPGLGNNKVKPSARGWIPSSASHLVISHESKPGRSHGTHVHLLDAAPHT